MGRVSLIFPLVTASSLSDDAVTRCRECLEGAGHEVDVVAVLDPAEGLPRQDARSVRWVSAFGGGLASAAMTGLLHSDGAVRMVLDPTQGYLPDDLVRVVEPVAEGRADLVVARREKSPDAPRGSLRMATGWTGRLALKVLGASSPLSGLVAVSPAVVDQVAGKYSPVGSRFAVDLLLRSKGRRVEVPVRVDRSASAAARPHLGVDDIRHLKRLADDRFGNASRLLQFCAVGASGMVIDLTCYALFQLAFGQTSLAGRRAPLVSGSLDLAVSGALAIAIALTWNFSLNRRLTFSDARGGSILRQFFAYVMSNAIGIALSFSLRLTLPEHVEFFNQHKLAAAVVGIVTATGISFTLARWVVFRKHSPVGTTRSPGTQPHAPAPMATAASAGVTEPGAAGSFG